MGVTVVTRIQNNVTVVTERIQMAQIRIDDEVYAKLKEAAEFNKRTIGQHITFLLDNEITFNEIRGMLAGGSNTGSVAMPKPVKENKASGNKKLDMQEIMKQAQEEVRSGEWDRKYKEAVEREKSRKKSLGDLTEEDLATAKVTFEEGPRFEEPVEWNEHSWPTV